MEKKWFSKGTYKNINCANCGKTQNEIATMDHHSGICPDCNISCIWFYITNENVTQIIPELAPNSINKFIDWCQSELNELEMTELVIELENIGKN